MPILLMLSVLGVELDVDSEESICEATAKIVQGEINYYMGLKYGGTVGMFSQPYYWWQAGEVFGGWVDYYQFCQKGNTTFHDLLYEAMIHQAGPKYDYMPTNQSMTEGNDDQGVWGLTLLQAAERNFTDPKDHSWLSMAQSIFNQMSSRWDDTSCGGGLRWQIFTWNSGYNYKNSISNGCFFNIAARLYRFTTDDRYLDEAEKIWNWMVEVGFMTDKKGEMVIYDGANDDDNCTDLSIHRWSYIYAVWLSGCAFLYNATEDSGWKDKMGEIIEASSYFFNNSILTEMTCAPSGKCNNDQRTFRALMARSLSQVVTLVPGEYDHIMENWLVPSAKAAAQSCSGGFDGVTCGFNWAASGWDNMAGLGEQMSAKETIMSLITSKHAPLTSHTGGTSKSKPDAGNDTSVSVNRNKIDIAGKDKAGAGVLTAVVLGLTLSGGVWMLF